jgi:PKD repeat protein
VSTQQNPVITYNTAGSYNVSLTATNNVGNNNETRTAYIIVEAAGFPPSANFSADNTSIIAGENVNFTDLSANDPTSSMWSFQGGFPSNSILTAPIVLYPNEGIFEVSLTSTNAFGSDTETRSDYIVVGLSSTIEGEYLRGFVLSPNPVSAGNVLRASFNLEQRTLLDFYVVNAGGKVVRQLSSR